VITKLLVTGASGFIGRGVVAAFAARGVAIRAAVRRPPSSPFPAGVETVQHPDLAQAFDWAPLVENVTAVVHFAGIAPTRGGVASALYDTVNREATARLAAAAARAGVKHFVYISSIRAQTGSAADHAVTERDPATPTDAYGRSKLAAEAAVRASGVPFTILRPVPVYGPGCVGYFALLLRAARSPWPLPLKNFVSRRSLLGLDNFISALTFVLDRAAAGEIYLLADPGIPPRLGDVAATLRREQDRWPLIVPFPIDYLELPLRLAGRMDIWERLFGNLRVDAGKLIGAGWQPAHDTRSGIAALAKAL
jgi:nucleoside-diphosphate-sugar epimerase